jgi:hypothetical protein
VIVAALTALSAGCGSTVPGTPRAGSNGPATAAGPAGLSSSQLGDLSTLDPCSLIGQDVLPRTIMAGGSSLQTLDHCATELNLGLDLGAGSTIHVLVGPLGRLPSEGSLAGKDVQLVRPLRVIKDLPEGRACARRLLFDDLVTLEVRAFHLGDQPVDPRLFSLADDVVSVTHRTLNDKLYQHLRLSAELARPARPMLVHTGRRGDRGA